MILTPRDISILALLAHLSVATAAQIRKQCFPNDHDGRLTRRRLQMLVAGGLLQKTRMEVVNPLSGMNAPVYFSARKALEFLSIHFEDASYLSRSSQRPQWQHLCHWVGLSDLHLLIDAAVARETVFTLDTWVNEYDEVRPDATCPEERYRLYTLLTHKPRLVNASDYMFTLTAGEHTKVFFGEAEHGTTHPEKAAAEKSPGYAELSRRRAHRRFCPKASEKFVVLVTAPDPKWRAHLVKAFSTKQEPDLYRFAALTELTPETFFRGNVWHRCDGRVGPLIKAEGVREPVPPGVRSVSEPGQNGRKEVVDTST